MAADAKTRDRNTVIEPILALRERSTIGLLGTVLNPVETVRIVRSIGDIAFEAMLALPRIATAMERLVPATRTLRELTALRGTLERLEQLGVFLGEELPEAQHEMESLRRQLVAIGNNTNSVQEQLRETTAAVRALGEVMRAALATNAATNRSVDVLGRVLEPRKPAERPAGSRSKPGRAS